MFSEHYACDNCGTSLAELEPRQFSFNSPYGACDECGGLGTRKEVNAQLLTADPSVTIVTNSRTSGEQSVRHELVHAFADLGEECAARRAPPSTPPPQTASAEMLRGGGWLPAPPMPGPRTGVRATALPDGRALIAGSSRFSTLA